MIIIIRYHTHDDCFYEWKFTFSLSYTRQECFWYVFVVSFISLLQNICNHIVLPLYSIYEHFHLFFGKIYLMYSRSINIRAKWNLKVSINGENGHSLLNLIDFLLRGNCLKYFVWDILIIKGWCNHNKCIFSERMHYYYFVKCIYK